MVVVVAAEVATIAVVEVDVVVREVATEVVTRIEDTKSVSMLGYLNRPKR
jgi:hypothetical protein